MDATVLIRCEILASRRSVTNDLAAIIYVCAQDLGLALQTQKRIACVSPQKPSITLHAPVEATDNKNLIWCLACRLSCFCPRTRVSVLIHSESAFTRNATPRTQRQLA